MNKSISFESVVKRILDNTCNTNKVVNENLSSRENPTNTYLYGGIKPTSNTVPDRNNINMLDIGKNEDEIAKSSTNKPYPLETVMDFIVSSGTALQQAESLVELALKQNKSLTKTQINKLKLIRQTLKSSIGNITKSAQHILDL